jgi:hypothetical protein
MADPTLTRRITRTIVIEGDEAAVNLMLQHSHYRREGESFLNKDTFGTKGTQVRCTLTAMEVSERTSPDEPWRGVELDEFGTRQEFHPRKQELK